MNIEARYNLLEKWQCLKVLLSPSLLSSLTQQANESPKHVEARNMTIWKVS